MQVKKPVIITIVVVAVLIIGVIIFTRHKGKEIYYYTFNDDENLVSQSIQIYDKKNDIKGRYSLFYGDRLISTTATDSAVVTTIICDLSKHPKIQIQFLDSEERYDVVYKKG